MKITETKLRQMIRKSLLAERRAGFVPYGKFVRAEADKQDPDKVKIISLLKKAVGQTDIYYDFWDFYDDFFEDVPLQVGVKPIDLVPEISIYLLNAGITGVDFEQYLHQLIDKPRAEVSGSVSEPGVEDTGEDDSTQDVPGDGTFVKQLELFDPAMNNWRSAQPSAEQLKWLIKNKDIKHVIRLNSNEKAGAMTMSQEERLCKSLNVVYNMGNSGYVNAHDPNHGRGVPGKGYVNSIANVLPVLAQGDCFIHCRAGADRTGYLVAAYLKSEGIETDLETLWNYTIRFNAWGGPGGYICKGSGGHIAYLEGFYPIDQWCKNRLGINPSERLEKCRPCRKYRNKSES